MIDWAKSAEMNGMSAHELQSHFKRFHKSTKKIIAVCAMCKHERIIQMWTHRDLCKSCGMMGHEVPETTRQKISESHIGIIPSDETRQKMAKSAKERPSMSDETRQKISEVHKGNTYNIGRIASNETKNKMSESAKGRTFSNDTRKLISNTLMGHEVSDETRIKMSCGRQDVTVEDFERFIGRHSKRSYVLSEDECLRINEKFIRSHFHHITKSIGIYIPAELHEHIAHNMRNGLNMGEINTLAIQFVNGGL